MHHLDKVVCTVCITFRFIRGSRFSKISRVNWISSAIKDSASLPHSAQDTAADSHARAYSRDGDPQTQNRNIRYRLHPIRGVARDK